VGVILAKLGIYNQKKRLSQLFLLLSGCLLCLNLISQNIIWLLGIVLATSICLSLSFPLTEGVYSDLLARLGHNDKHLIALIGAIGNLAYIIGPILSGYLAGRYNEATAFSFIGLLTIIVTTLLLIFTPRKLKLPQNQISAI
jgi:MFS family permease